jgi:hypothetical protein
MVVKMAMFGEFYADEFAEYLNPQLLRINQRKGKGAPFAMFINGRRLTPTETRAIRRWRTGEAKTVTLATVDKWSMRFDLPLWEIEEKVGRMAL